LLTLIHFRGDRRAGAGEESGVTTPEGPSVQELSAERTALSSERTGLAVTRTLMSADRTLMAWVRTSLSLLSFSFTIYRILEELPRLANRMPGNSSARNAGLLLAAMGTFAMVIGTVEYWSTLKMLSQLKHFRLTRPALVMAFLMSIMGVALFLAISARAL
jgi:putative membrane protein